MAEKKIIAVMGATGAQGGGLMRAILAEPGGDFAARGITRDPSSDRAKALADAGAEMVAANSYDLDSLKRAFAGAYGIYCVSFFWHTLSAEKEGEEIRNMAAAAEAARPRHVIWSTLEDTRTHIPLSDDRMPTLQGRYKVAHFDAKGEHDRAFSALPTTYMLASFYWENFIKFGQGPRPAADGELVLALPIGSSKMAGIAAEDIGRCALGILERGDALVGQHIGVAGEQLTGDEMAAAFTRHLGRTVRYRAMSPAEYRALGFPGAEDMGNMYQFYDEFAHVVNATRNVARSRELNPKLQDFDTWLSAHKDAIPL